MQTGDHHHEVRGAYPAQTIRGGEESPKTSMLGHLRALLYRSPIPGMKVVFGPEVPVARRSCWVVMLMVFSGLTCWDIVRTLSDFTERPVAIDISLSEIERGQLPLPAITVCNMNQVRRSVLCGNDSVLAIQPDADYWKERLCNGRPIENVWMSEEVLREADNFTEWVMKTQRRNTALGSRMGHQREDLYLECSFGSLDCRNESLLYAVPFGRYGTCYCFNFRHGFSFTPENTGVIANGLRLVLDAEIDEYLPLSTEVGFKVMIHEPGVESDYNRNGIHIPPDFVTYLRISKKCLDACLQLTIFQRCRCMDHTVRTFNISGAKLCCPNDTKLSTGRRSPIEHGLRTMAKLIIYLDEKIEKRRRYAQFPFSSLVTNIGGTMGIYLGLSFVMLFSVVETVATALARTVTSFKVVEHVTEERSSSDGNSPKSSGR